MVHQISVLNRLAYGAQAGIDDEKRNAFSGRSPWLSAIANGIQSAFFTVSP
jgi:hypothetical protein